MEVIKATWENRNLGKDAYEVFIEQEDLQNFFSIEKELASLRDADAYVTIKMPVGNLVILHQLQDMGFYFMELQFLVSKYVANYETPSPYQRILSSIDYVEIPKDEKSWIDILDNLSVDMFLSDRIRLDPKLDKMVAFIRYKNWCLDLLHDENAHMFAFNRKGTNIGFVIVKGELSKVCRGILGGVFASKSFPSLGLATIDAPLIVAKRMGYDIFKTMVSSNNRQALKIYFSFGFQLDKEYYVLRSLK